jgi:hypothetical protein
MERSEFQLMMKNAKWRDFQEGDTIYEEGRDVYVLNFIVQGIVRLKTAGQNFNIGSGRIFDIRICSLFGIFLGFEHNSMRKAEAVTKVRLITWDMEDVIHMASGARGPALPNYWRGMALYCVTAELVASNGGKAYSSKGMPEAKAWHSGVRTLDMTEPLTDEESAALKTTLLGTISWIIRSMNMWPVPGLRHYGMPASGAMARNRLLLEQQLVRTGALVPKVLSSFQGDYEDTMGPSRIGMALSRMGSSLVSAGSLGLNASQRQGSLPTFQQQLPSVIPEDHARSSSKGAMFPLPKEAQQLEDNQQRVAVMLDASEDQGLSTSET